MKKINVKGPIVSNDEKWIYEMFEIDATCPNDITSQLDEFPNEPVEVHINSGGGSVYDASEIYTALRMHGSDVETKIVGLAASAASVIAMAGKPLSMSPTAKMMIHNASMIAIGDYHEMDKSSEILKATNIAISNAYQEKSGLSQDELIELMDKETWFTAQSAKEHGLIDEIMFEKEQSPRLVATNANSGMIPHEVIEKIRNEKATPPEETNDREDIVKRIEGLQLEFNELKAKLDANVTIDAEKLKKEMKKEESKFSRFLF